MSEKSYGVVYVLTSPSGKQYVGQTTKTLEHRLSTHKGATKAGANYPINNSIRKYGLENFDVEILANAENQDKLDALECYWIRELKTCKIGMNLSPGGKGWSPEKRAWMSGLMKGREFSEETRKKFSKAQSGKNNPMYGKKHTDEVREKISESHRKRSKEDVENEKMGLLENAERIGILHGTENRYLNYGCRCSACRAAYTLYKRELKERHKNGVYGHTPEVGARISKAKMGHEVSQETRNKISRSLKKRSLMRKENGY